MVRDFYPRSLLVLLRPPTRADLVKRLVGRGASDDFPRRRSSLVDSEVDVGDGLYDHVLINAEVSSTTNDL